jgi:hypothetical protein
VSLCVEQRSGGGGVDAAGHGHGDEVWRLQSQCPLLDDSLRRCREEIGQTGADEPGRLQVHCWLDERFQWRKSFKVR